MSASSWQFQALEQSAWWRGKPSRSRHWLQRWNKGSFIQLLCGVMPEPSTAALGVAQLTASLAASRASRIATPANAKGKKTNETSGLQPVGSSSSPGRGSCSSKTSAGCSPRKRVLIQGRSVSGVTYKDWVSTLRQDCSQRRKSAQRTNVSVFSSSASSQASAWPTPTANDWKGSGPTLERKDGQMRGDRLDYATEQLWSAPRASDAEKGGPNQSFGAGGVPLPAQAVQWATPSVADTTGGRMSRSKERSNELLLKGQAFVLSENWSTPRVSSERTSSIALERPDSVSSLSIAQQAEMVMGEVPREIYLVSEKTQRRLGFDPSSLRGQLTYPVGATLSHPRRSLNPLFVEWLMGWPPGWTLLAWTDFACSEMELSHFKQRMRSALLSLGLPHEAPPAQLALFG